MAWTDEGVQQPLTHREQEVLELVASGYSAKQIASHIGIAPRTVESHVESLRLKMRARNKTHMVTQAVLAGLLLRPERSSPDPAV